MPTAQFVDEYEPEEVEEKKKKKVRRIDVEWQGTKVVLPDGMDYEEAIKALELRQQQDNQEIDLSETIRAFPLDGAVAFQKALREIYGWTSLVPTMGFWGPSNPALISVPIGYDETIKVPWGQVAVPKIRGTLATGWTEVEGLPQFRISASIRRADKTAFENLVALVKKYVAEESIYKGQAVKVQFRDKDGDPRDFDPRFSPQFMDLKSFDATELVYPIATEKAVTTNLYNLIQHTENCRKQKIPLKRGIVLEGTYGTGKTLTAWQTAQLCVENGWTFLMLDDVRDLHQALQFARMYEPCVVFAEDVDHATSGKRNDEMTRIFNTIDGIESKGHEILTVLTTNRVNSIHPGFIRPGRIDAVINIGPPDEHATAKLVRRYAQNYAGENILDPELTDEQIIKAMRPVKMANSAFIREVVERAKLAAVSHSDEVMVIHENDLAIAAESMKAHLRLVCPELVDVAEREAIMASGEEVDPMKFALDVLGDELVYKIFESLADPSVLKKVVLKQKKRNMGPSIN